MMVFTEAAELRVVGTQFNVNARDESTKLIVNEGEVILKRTTDGESVNVTPQHQVVASLRDAKQLRSIKRARQVHAWKSDLQSETSHGKWIPSTMELVSPDINQQINQVFDNLSAIAVAAGTTLNDAVKLTVYLTDLGHFSNVNEVMAQRLGQPYPARVALEVSALPRSALVEIDAIVAIS